MRKNNTTELLQRIEQRLKILEDDNTTLKRMLNELNFADLMHDSMQNKKWLKNKAFSLFGWAANYSFIYTLFRILDNTKVKNILEFGMGQTSLLTSQYVAHKNKKAVLNICEHNQDWIDIFKKQLPKSERIHINHPEVESFDFEGQLNDKYKDLSTVTTDRKFDLIIVDGPIGGGKNFPRSNIIDLIPENLAEEFIIIFDDAERAGEQLIIKKTEGKLRLLNLKFSVFSRQGIKKQYIITSPKYNFVKFL